MLISVKETSSHGLDAITCENCSLFQLCLPMGIAQPDLALLDRVIKRRRTLRRGEALFVPEQPFRYVYAVRSGSIKTYAPMHDGPHQITGFHLPGELLGLDAINEGIHGCGAVALETSSVCELPLDKLEELGGIVTSMQRQMMRIMSRQILHDQGLQVLLCRKNAEQRLAAFLANLAMRFKQRGFSAQEFNLSMSRSDIGNYLGLAKETVSRVFTRFHEDRIAVITLKHVRLSDLPRLSVLAGLEPLAE